LYGNEENEFDMMPYFSHTSTAVTDVRCSLIFKIAHCNYFW